MAQIMPLPEAMEGFTHLIPHAAGREVILSQRRRGPTPTEGAA